MCSSKDKLRVGSIVKPRSLTFCTGRIVFPRNVKDVSGGMCFNICGEPKNIIFVLSGFARRLFVHKYVEMVERSLFIGSSTSSKFPTRKDKITFQLTVEWNRGKIVNEDIEQKRSKCTALWDSFRDRNKVRCFSLNPNSLRPTRKITPKPFKCMG